jgi:hypothetical protein
MFYGLPADLHDLAQRQHGVLSSAQLAKTGLTRNGLSSRVDAGHWQRLHRGVYATFSGEPGREAVLWAAVLSAGPGAMLSYWTAAEVAGLTDKPGEIVHVTIPRERRIARTPGIAIHLSVRADRALHPARLPPQTRIEETILDLAGAARSLDDTCGWVTRGIGRRLTTAPKLLVAIDARGKMRWRTELAELLSPEVDGVHSPLEWRYYRDVERPHGLPGGDRQARYLRDGHSEYRDKLYKAYGVALELDGRIAHPGDKRWDDIRRDNAAAAGGTITLRYGWVEVVIRPCFVAAEVVLVLMSRGFTGARACSPGCPVATAIEQYRRSA